MDNIIGACVGYKSKFKRIIALTLLITIVISQVYTQRVKASDIALTLGVVGGSLGTAVSLPVIATIGAIALSGVGVNLVLTDLAKSSGMTKSEYLENQLNQFITSTGSTVDEFVSTYSSGISILKDGTIQLGNEVSNMYKELWNSISSHSIYNTVDDIPNYLTDNQGFYGYQVPYKFETESRYDGMGGGYTCTVTPLGDTLLYITKDWYSSEQGYQIRVRAYSATNNPQALVTQVGLNGKVVEELRSVNYVTSWSDYLKSQEFTHFLTSTSSPKVDLVGNAYGAGYVGNVQDVINLTDKDLGLTDGYIVNPKVLGQVQGADIPVNGTIANEDYIALLQQLLEGVQDISLELTDGVALDIPVSTTLQPDISISDNSKPDTPDVPVVIPDGDYQYNLTDIFPFCIPFDIYDMIKLLKAEPKAPSFEWKFYIPDVCDELIVIDLSIFDDVAKVGRTMFLLLFCVGLGFATKNLIKW